MIQSPAIDKMVHSENITKKDKKHLKIKVSPPRTRDEKSLAPPPLLRVPSLSFSEK